MLDDLIHQATELEDRLSASSEKPLKRVAVFDLDGTLIEGDVGDAVFAYLEMAGHDMGLKWQEYQRLLRRHRSRAYIDMVRSLSGLQVSTVEDATDAVMGSSAEYLNLGATRIAIPRPRAELHEFVSFLQGRNYEVYILSASNHVSVQRVAERWFNVPHSRAFGIQTRIVSGRFTDQLLEPAPVWDGKVSLFRRISPHYAPLITATDSYLDLPLLQMTHFSGISFWVGNDRLQFETVQSLLDRRHRFSHVYIGDQQFLQDF